jgi:hypothetical protein
MQKGNAFNNALQNHLESSMNERDQDLARAEVSFFIYFDEAHVLTKVEPIAGQPLPKSKYHILGRVLGSMHLLPFFVSWRGSGERL